MYDLDLIVEMTAMCMLLSFKWKTLNNLIVTIAAKYFIENNITIGLRSIFLYSLYIQEFYLCVSYTHEA